jgi:hypothetical protein
VADLAFLVGCADHGDGRGVKKVFQAGFAHIAFP